MSLPDNPNLDHLRRQARTLQRGVRTGDPGALARVQRHDLPAGPTFALSAAQLVVAREYGFASWSRLRHYLDVVADHGWTATPEDSTDAPPDRFCRLACLTYDPADGPGRWDRARLLLADQPELTRDHIWAAAAAVQPSTMERLLRADPGLARRPGGPYGWRPLCYLAYSRFDPQVALDAVLACARMLLDAGADPNEGYLWNGQPCPFTLLTGIFGEGELGPYRQPRHPHSIVLARLLLDAGADPNDSQTLYNRMFGPDNDHLELLFEYGLGRGDSVWRARVGELIDTPTGALRSLLQWAVEHEQLDRIRLLVAHGVDLQGAYADGRTPLDIARLNGSAAMADALVALGAEPNALDPVGELIAAAFRPDRAAVERQLAADPGLLARVKATRPGLVVWAAARSRVDTVRLLVELGFDVNAQARSDVPLEQEWETALHRAAFDGDLELARSLLDLGADPAITDARFGSTPLDWARHGGQEELVALLKPLTPS